ncbi:MAG: ATPase, partial [Oceanospirillales bacterium LUC14_002_19_P2]
MKHAMIDLETMGNGSQAAIVAIGACFFDPVKGTVGNTFYQPVSLESAVSAGLIM